MAIISGLMARLCQFSLYLYRVLLEMGLGSFVRLIAVQKLLRWVTYGFYQDTDRNYDPPQWYDGFTLSISSHDFAFGFHKMSRTNEDSIPCL